MQFFRVRSAIINQCWCTFSNKPSYNHCTLFIRSLLDTIPASIAMNDIDKVEHRKLNESCSELNVIKLVKQMLSNYSFGIASFSFRQRRDLIEIEHKSPFLAYPLPAYSYECIFVFVFVISHVYPVW